MPDNTKVLYETAAPSGAADALFGIFKQDVEMEQYAKKKDIETNAAAKLKEQENKFATSLLTLKNQYDVSMADKAATNAQNALLAKGTALGGFAQKQALETSRQTGQSIPGLTSQMPDPSGYNTEQDGWMQDTIDPRAGEAAAKLMENVFSSELRKKEVKEKASYDDARILLRDKLELISDDEAAAARALHGELKTMDPTNMNIPLLQGFMTPGQSHKRDYYKVIPQISAQVEKSKAQLAYGKAMESARLARQVQLHEMDNTTKKAIADLTKGPTAAGKAMDTLRKNQSGIMTIFQTYRAEASELNKAFGGGMLSTADEKINRARLLEVNEEIEKIRPRLEELNKAMLQHTATVTPNVMSPAEKQAKSAKIIQEVLKGRDPKKLSKDEYTKANAEIEARMKQP